MMNPKGDSPALGCSLEEDDIFWGTVHNIILNNNEFNCYTIDCKPLTEDYPKCDYIFDKPDIL